MQRACEGVAIAAGLGGLEWATLRQIHSTEIKEAKGGGCLGEADGLWTGQPGVALAIQTADCVPLLLMDKGLRRVAAVHAGWRGVWGGIVQLQLQLWLRGGTQPKDIEIALGPSIGPCCYEVDEEMGRRFAQRWGEGVISKPRGMPKPRLHLAEALRLELLSLGLASSQVEAAGVCTFCDRRFHSYRREGGRAGRQLSWVVCRF